jgi:hypothetical protein
VAKRFPYTKYYTTINLNPWAELWLPFLLSSLLFFLTSHTLQAARDRPLPLL